MAQPVKCFVILAGAFACIRIIREQSRLHQMLGETRCQLFDASTTLDLLSEALSELEAVIRIGNA